MNISNNPFECGRKLKTGFDYFANGFTKKQLIDVFYHLIAEKRQGQLLLECASFSDIDDMYNPGEDLYGDDADRMTTEMLLEAIRVKQYAQTDKTMAALQRVLNKHLASVGDITAGEATIGKPKKSGLFASVTVQFPLSDGQTLSIIFHSPDNNKMKITGTDEILAFRWLLNKRDITNAVSPDKAEEGTAKDVSLEDVGIRCAQLVVKNSARFAAKSADLVAAKKLMEETQAQVAALQTGNSGLQDSLKAQADSSELIDAQINSTQKRLDKQIAYNDELRAKLEGMKAVGAGNSGKSEGVDTTGVAGKAAADAAAFEEKKAAFEEELKGRGFNGGVYSSNIITIKTDMGGNGQPGYYIDINAGTPEDQKHFSSKTLSGLDAQITKDLAWIDKKLAEIKKKEAEIKKKKAQVKGATAENQIELEVEQLATLGTANITDVGGENIYIEKDGVYYFAKVTNTDKYAVGVHDFAAAMKKADENVNPEVTAALGILNDIVGGKYGMDRKAIDKSLDDAAAALEAQGLMEEYDELLNQAADELTRVLKEAAKGVA